MNSQFNVKPKYAKNPYLKNVFEKDNVNKWMGLNAEKSADEILEYIRERMKQIKYTLDTNKTRLATVNKYLHKKEYNGLTALVIQGESALEELTNLEDFATNYYQRVKASTWGKMFLKDEQDSNEYIK